MLVHTNVTISQYIESPVFFSFVFIFQEKPFACDYCPKRYNQKDQLLHHVNALHTENPIITIRKCGLCDKEFKYASGLSRHLATHYGRTFPCSCGRVFNDKSALRRHEGAIHGKDCGKSDKDKTSN